MRKMRRRGIGLGERSESCIVCWLQQWSLRGRVRSGGNAPPLAQNWLGQTGHHVLFDRRLMSS